MFTNSFTLTNNFPILGILWHVNFAIDSELSAFSFTKSNAVTVFSLESREFDLSYSNTLEIYY